MDGDSTLMLDKNDKTVKWVLDRLRQDNTRKASTLAIYQAVPVYYTASAVKQSGTMTATKRDALIADSYEKFVAPAFVKFLQDNYEFQAPEWLTMGLMGQTTLSDTDKKYYDRTKDAVWDRYQVTAREIRKTVTPWMNKWMTKSGSVDKLPSDTQHAILMQELHEHLWGETKAGTARKMPQAEFELRCAKGERLEIIKDDDDDHGTTIPQRGSPDLGSAEEGTDEPIAREGGAPGGESNPSDGASSYDDQSGEDKGTGDGSGGLPQTRSSPEGRDNSRDDTAVTVRTRMPENWLHRYSLVICYFTRISESPDPDLDIQSSNGPPSKRARLSEGGVCDLNDSGVAAYEDVTDSGGGRLSRRALNLLGRINEPSGRRDVKEDRAPEAKGLRVEKCLAAFADRLVSSGDDRKDTLAESLRAVASAMKELVNVRRQHFDREERKKEVDWRTKQVEWLKLGIRTFDEMGMTAQAQEAKAKLANLLLQPFTPDVPLGPEDAGSAAGGNRNTNDDARSAHAGANGNLGDG